ncbi:ankyrin repeat domain-containing protein [Virgibacillus alimentarius]|uniref:ankyrin repeat domain-containing protein n=1 Tax=Virgibacillus alimentarius TaxID=698769 RepID=UPI00049381AA|nr:ankyrin repeat domain-containing protein [Virgibacillus alimentarius]
MTRFILFIVIAISTLSIAVLLSNNSHTSYTTSILGDQFKDDSEKIFGTINHYFEHGYELNEKDVQSFEEYILKYKSDDKTTKESNIYDLVVNIILDAKDSYEANQREDVYALRDALEMYLTHRQELKGYISPDVSGLDMVADNSYQQDNKKSDSPKINDTESDNGNTVSEDNVKDKEQVAEGHGDTSKENSSVELSNEELLYLAIPDNEIDMVERLINNGVNVNVDIKGTRPLIVAIRDARLEIAEMLLEAGADPNLTSSATNYSPLEAAFDVFPEGEAKTEDVIYELAGLLLMNGANSNTVFVNGSSALDVAVDRKLDSVVELLKSFGAK